MDELHGPPLKLPRIFIEGQDDVLEEFFLIVYQVGEYVVCCFFFRFFYIFLAMFLHAVTSRIVNK